ncbi:MAG: RDD family protein [Parachlamydiales bacterium]|nr:RDD family protein [Parachlamydiales bacterium]
MAATQRERDRLHSAKHGGFWMRLVAFVIDMVIITILTYLFMFLVEFLVGGTEAIVTSHDQTLATNQPVPSDQVVVTTDDYVTTVPVWPFALASQIVFIAVPWLYYTLFESSTLQATPGKRVLNMRVVDGKNDRLTFARANGRYWAKIISWLILTIGFLMIGWTRHKQGLHDKMAHTYVLMNS